MSINILINVIKHFKLVAKHKFLVFKFCCKLGVPFRGLVHDLSKYSFEEFGESIKYYTGTKSPISECKEKNGYSRAWLHHKGRNKHHLEYWVDLTAPNPAPVIEYKYVAEMVSDKMAAGIVYNGENWTNSSQYDYWEKEKKKTIMNPKIEKFFTQVFLEVKENGIDKTLTKQNIKELYKKYCIDDNTKYKLEFEFKWIKEK